MTTLYMPKRKTLTDTFEEAQQQVNKLASALHRLTRDKGSLFDANEVYTALQAAERRLKCAALAFFEDRRYTEHGDFTNCYRGGFY